MAFPNSEKAFVFSWCTGYSLASLQDHSQLKVDGAVRICFITTQVYRMYVVADAEGYHYWPFVFEDGMWRKLHKHLWVVGSPKPGDFKDEGQLWESLCFQMVEQFRSSVEGFYDEHPTKDEVLQRLGVGAKVGRLDELRYSWHSTDVQDDEEWDGAVEIVCNDGSLLIPYKGSEDCNPNCTLITKYATFYPDSLVQSTVQRANCWMDKVSSAMRNMHWSNVRLYLEHKGGQA